MANFTNLIQSVRDTVYENPNGGITATKLQQLLLEMIADIDDVKMDKIDGITSISFDSATDTLTINGVNYLLTQGGGPTPPEPPTPVDVYSKPILDTCSPLGIVPGEGATLTAANFTASYYQDWTRDGVSQTPITTGGTLKFSLTQSGSYNTSITIGQNNTGSMKSIVIYAKVTMNGQTSDAKPVTLSQAIRQVNQLKYAEIPITKSQRNGILDNPSSVMDYLNDSEIKSSIANYITVNNTTISDYILADTDIQTHNDEYEILTTSEGNFIQVFLLTNTEHNIIGYDDLGGSPSSYYQVDLEDLTPFNSFKWVETNYVLNGTQYKLITILNYASDTLSLKIQIKG